MQISIIGDGAFGSFLRELLSPYFEISSAAETLILAVPISAYETLAAENVDKHLINVCSVQLPSTEHILKHTESVTCIHPLFGARTPADKRNSVVTRTITDAAGDSAKFADAEKEFLEGFAKVSALMYVDHKGARFTPDTHDRLMARTHAAAVLAAKQMKVFVERAEDIPDELLPNSFRLMRDFVKTLDDMPQGTIESIMANPYF
jgi:prephenate dehydrogenase